MTVLHSRNADAADPADVADAADVKDPQDAAAESDLREDLGRYADLGAFTLTTDTHAWYAALGTVATPEDARAASSALAELRGHDLTQTWEAVTAIAADAKLDEPGTVAKTVLLVELLQRVHRTSATLTAAAYDADLDALAAATADSAWRRERGIKLSWLRARALRKQATALATDRRTRREDLHEALASAEIERRAWAALDPSGTLPTAPGDGLLVERTAQAFDAINAGLRELARVLPDHDLDGLPFVDLVDLVERLAADEGTLYRLPTIHSLRATLEEAGLGDLLAELAAAKADRRAADAAYAARQALAAGQRDGLAETGAPAGEDVVEGAAAEAEVEVEVEAEAEAEAEAEDVTEAETVTETEDVPSAVSLPAPSPAADDLVAAAAAALVETEDAPVEAVEETAVEAAAEAEAEVEEPEAVEVEVTAEPVEVVEAEVEVVEPETATEEIAEAVVEAPVEAVEMPVEAEAEAEVEEPEAVEAEVTAEPVEVIAETAVEAVVEELVEPEAVPEAEPVAEAEAVEPDAIVAVEPEAVEPETIEPEAVVEPLAEVEAPAEASAEAPAETTQEASETSEASDVPEALVAVEAEVTDEPEVAAEPEPEAEPVAEAPAPAEAETVAEAEAVEAEQPAEPAAPAGRPAKPDFTPGRPVTAYSADELLEVVRWVDGDGVERSEEELLRAAMKELGFARLGPRIKEALGAAVTAARA
ncbi:hypothetical protein [Kitasatospora sp. NPDC093558]|uniref:hypothetical protein n=1 Tax=Kitasatospora sp. NPDC093558 TaxID=3155201 RepID=UPI00341BE720